jgi:hypothetical protein
MEAQPQSNQPDWTTEYQPKSPDEISPVVGDRMRDYTDPTKDWTHDDITDDMFTRYGKGELTRSELFSIIEALG